MIKTTEIPSNYKYMIDRALYDINMRAKNLAFMLDKNLDNPEFLNSDLYKRLEDDLVDMYINRWVTITSMFTTLGISVEAYVQMNPITGIYSAIEVVEE